MNDIIQTGYLKNVLHQDAAEFTTEAQHFSEFGRYTNHPYNTSPKSKFFKYWEEQGRRSVYGHNIGRDWIPGYYYHFLNFCPILKAQDIREDIVQQMGGGTMIDYVESDIMAMGMAERIEGFPDFYDGHYKYFHYLNDAELRGEHGSVIKARTRGFSFMGGGMMNRNFHLLPGSKSYAFADDKEYLTEDGILSKTWEIMDFHTENTAWAKRRHKKDAEMHKRASYEITVNGLKIEKGFRSEILGVSLHHNYNKARGKRGKLILFEESGKNPHLLKAWNIALRSVSVGRKSIGLMIAFGTGGTEDADFMGLEQLFYEGGGYRVRMVPNEWDIGAQNQKCGFFYSAAQNYEGCMDENGNSDWKKASSIVLNERETVKKETKNPDAILRHIAEDPLTPQEAVLRISGSIFPTNDLKKHLAYLRMHPEKYEATEYIGELNFNENGKIHWSPSNDLKPIRGYPHNDLDNINGAVIIYEHPVANRDGIIPHGIYIASSDNYDHDQSTTQSLGSTLVMNRLTERIVAEYTGRPQTAQMYYETERRLLLYYNALCNYENNLKGLHAYFEKMHSTHMLCDTPPNIIDKLDDKSLMNRGKGTPGTTPIKNWGCELILTWLLAPIVPGSNIMNLHKIRSEPLLQELIYHSKEGNFDRVDALIYLMIYKDQVTNIITTYDKPQNEIDPFFANHPLFKENILKEVVNDPFKSIKDASRIKSKEPQSILDYIPRNND
jgi:hypothetical protein